MSLKYAARTHVYEDIGTSMHLIYDRKTKKLYVCVWETKSGDYIALSKAWLKERVDNDVNPTPELLALFDSEEEEKEE